MLCGLGQEAITRRPTTLEGKTMSAVLVNFSQDVLSGVVQVRSQQVLDELTPFDLLQAAVVPDPDDVVGKAAAWAQGQGVEKSDRIQLYSGPKRSTRRRAPGPGTDGGVPTSSKKRPTVASLAESMESLLNTLPATERAGSSGENQGCKTIRQSIWLEETLGWLSYQWIVTSISGDISADQADATPQEYVLASKSDFLPGRGPGVCTRDVHGLLRTPQWTKQHSPQKGIIPVLVLALGFHVLGCAAMLLVPTGLDAIFRAT